MERSIRKSRDLVPMAIAITLMLILAGQLVAVTAMTADQANAGPSIVIIKLMDDENVNWAVDDIVNRLEEFVPDDLWIKDRIRVIETDDPSIVLDMYGDIIIYVSHGGRMSLVTGDHLTTWKEMARIVEASPAILHQFAVCFSSNIIQYGSEDASQYVYGVPGPRPAEFIDIDIASNVMLALGMDSKAVQESRERDILAWKEILSLGTAPHFLSFNYVTFDAIQEANAEFEEVNGYEYEGVTYDYFWDLQPITSFSSVPDAIEDYVTFYWANSYDSNGNWFVRDLNDPNLLYNRTWVTETIAGIPATYFQIGSYNGSIQIDQYGQVDILAGGTIENDVEWMNLGRPGVGQFYVSLQKRDGVWEEGSMERCQSDAGRMYGDSCTTPLLEYDSTWPVLSSPGPTRYEATGTLASEGSSYTIVSIASGTEWHGPSFVRPLPFAFRMEDFGCFKADLGFLDTTDPTLLATTTVSLYDENKQLALYLMAYDFSTSSVCTQFSIAYQQGQGSGWALSSPSTFYAGRNGTLQIFLDEDNGLRVDMPDRDPSLIAFKDLINMDRIIKYIAIQSYAYSTYEQCHPIIANISVSCINSEYDIFYYDCQSTSGWISEPSSTDFEEPRQINTGQLHAENGYLYADNIPSGAPWKWGPLFVRELPQVVPLSGIRLFESVIELTYQSGRMGDLLVCLFDANKEQVMYFCAYDSQSGSSSDRYLVFSKSAQEGGAVDNWHESTVYGSWKATFKFWYDMTSGSVISSVDDGTPLTHTHYTEGNFDSSRPVKYIGIQFARAITYPYHDYRLKLHSIKLEVSPTRYVWSDNCDSTDGWIRLPASAGFESPYQLNDSGTLYSSGGYLYADGIASGASWKWGPLFVKEIPGFVKVRDIYSLTAQIQFTYVSNRMGDLAVALFDENKELVASLVAYDSWYSSLTYRYINYFKADCEGGGYNSWLESTPSGSWTAKYQFYCDPITKAAMSKLDDGTPLTHTHFTAQNYDADRIVRYIGIQFVRARTYTYNGPYLKLDFIKLIYNRHCTEFHDPCSNTVGWTKDLAWPDTVYETADGNLGTGGSPASYLQASGFSSMEKGPFWYKELAQPILVKQFGELAVQLQNPGTGTRGGFILCLYDEDKAMVTRIGFLDYSTLEAGGVFVAWRGEQGSDLGDFAPGLDSQTQQSWEMTMRMYRTIDNIIVAEIPGFDLQTIVSADEWAMESSRIIRYIGIQWIYLGSSFNNVRFEDLMVRSGCTFTSSDNIYGLISLSGLQSPTPTVPPPKQSEVPPLTIDLTLDFGFWPVFLIGFNYEVADVFLAVLQIGVDILMQFSFRDISLRPLSGGVSETTAQNAISESQNAIYALLADAIVPSLGLAFTIVAQGLKVVAMAGVAPWLLVAASILTFAAGIALITLSAQILVDYVGTLFEPGWGKALAFIFRYLIFTISMFLGLYWKFTTLQASQEQAVIEALQAGYEFPDGITQYVAQKNAAGLTWGTFAYWIVIMGLLIWAIVYGIDCVSYCLSN